MAVKLKELNEIQLLLLSFLNLCVFFFLLCVLMSSLVEARLKILCYYNSINNLETVKNI